jgi:hypothetical protein
MKKNNLSLSSSISDWAVEENEATVKTEVELAEIREALSPVISFRKGNFGSLLVKR